MLLPPSLECLSHLIEGEAVTGYEHRWAKDASGRLWVCKKEIDVAVQVIASEIIGWHLARYLQVPVPRAAIYRDPSRPNAVSWLSEAVQPAFHWDPNRLESIKNYQDLGNIVVLDIIIWNEDRNSRNILLQPKPDQMHLDMWAIDTGDALVGYADDFLNRGHGTPQTMRAQGIPFARIRERAMEVAHRATSIIPSYLAGAVREAYELTGLPRMDEVVQVLEHRCKRAPTLVQQYFSEVSS